MRTLVLAERPFRDLRSRAILNCVTARLGADPPPLLAMRAPRGVPGFDPVELEPDAAALGVAQVVIVGVFQERPALEWALRVAAAARATGAAVGTLSLSVERGAARRDAPEGIAVLDAAGLLEVREHHTANALMVWRVGAPIRIRAYPERDVAPDAALPVSLPPGPLLGLAILGGEEVRRAVMRDGPILRALLAPMQDWPILPLPAEMPDSPLDDLSGSRDFAAAVLPAVQFLLPDLADATWRRRHLTVRRLKAFAARCAVVVTNQDLAAACAIANGVPVLGLALGTDRRIVSCLAALANELPAGSDLVFPQRHHSAAASFANSSARA